MFVCQSLEDLMILFCHTVRSRKICANGLHVQCTDNKHKKGQARVGGEMLSGGDT